MYINTIIIKVLNKKIKKYNERNMSNNIQKWNIYEIIVKIYYNM